MSGDTTNAKSASKRKQPESDVVDETATTTTEPKQKKQKKSKDKSQKEVVETQESTEPATEESKEEKKAKKASKKAKKVEPEVPVTETEATPSTSTEQKFEPAVEQEEPVTQDGPAETEAAASGEVPKKKKERKRNKNNRKQTGQGEASKTDTGNGTPEEDASLTEQAQKGIQYAWLYTHRNLKSLPEGEAKDDGTYWKFNKARQGWLWKNVWNEEIIPSKYVELVIGYLSSMQGQARQKLMDEAQKIVDTPVQTAEEPVKEEATATDGGEEEGKASGEKEETAVQAETEIEAEEKPEVVSAEKHRRAQLVVESLRS